MPQGFLGFLCPIGAQIFKTASLCPVAVPEIFRFDLNILSHYFLIVKRIFVFCVSFIRLLVLTLLGNRDKMKKEFYEFREALWLLRLD